jgi:hypothetical protein
MGRGVVTRRRQAVDVTGAPQTPNDLGVVDPIRLPPMLGRGGRWLIGLPLVARIFLVLAVIDFIDLDARWLANLGPDASPVWIISFFLNVAFPVLEVLLPVAVWTRRPDSGREVPFIGWGSVAVAMSGILSSARDHANGLVGDPFGAQAASNDAAIFLAVALQIATAVVLGGGLVAIGLGLERIRVAAPNRTLRRLTIVAATIIATSALVMFVSNFAEVSTYEHADPSIYGDGSISRYLAMIQAASLWTVVPTLGGAYLAWTLVRAVADAPGNRRAIGAGAVVAGAGALTGAVALISFIIFAWITSFAPQTDFDQEIAIQDAAIWLPVGGRFAEVVGAAAMVAAFSFGLHDRVPDRAVSEPEAA